MKVNTNKSEAVLLAEWRNKPLANIPYPICDKVAYFDCMVGNITKDDREPMVWPKKKGGGHVECGCQSQGNQLHVGIEPGDQQVIQGPKRST
jgi:hypothetical protein